ncbi:MAG: rod shape-determining protein MreC [Oscillibacter sp.]|nr:rod shape-determining protein MreC [Oscillibacter sp.]
MKNFLKNHGIWVLFAGAVIAAALALMSFFNASPLVNITGVLTSPFRSGYTAVATWFNDKQAYYKDIKALEAENAALKKTIAEMEETVRQAQADRDENELLRQLLGLRAQRRDLSDLEAATITERSVTNWVSSFTLNKGTTHGVEVGNSVIDATGALVGVISEAGYNWSTVLTTVDTDTSLGARVFRTKDLGIAQGDFSLMGEDLLRLDYLPSDADLLAGDLVETSGLGGFYPSGLVIGYVKEVRMDDSGASSYAIVTPAADLDALTEVFVVKSFEIVT